MTSIEIYGNAPRVSVDKLRAHPQNDNVESKFTFDKLVATLKKDGFAQPITVRSGNEKGKFKDGLLEIVGGEHRWKAARAAGMTEVPIHDLGCISDLKTKKLLLGLNKIHGESDQDKLSALLRDISSQDVSELENLPFDQDSLKDLLDNEVTLEDLDGVGDIDSDSGSIDIEGGTTKPNVRDLLVILDTTGMKAPDCKRLLDAARQWSFGREDQTTKPWESLIHILEENTIQR